MKFQTLRNLPSQMKTILLGIALVLFLSSKAEAGWWKINLQPVGSLNCNNTVNGTWEATVVVGEPGSSLSEIKFDWAARAPEPTTASGQSATFSIGTHIQQNPVQWFYEGPLNSKLHAKGSVTATLEWQADNGEDLPPPEVIVRESAWANAQDNPGDFVAGFDSIDLRANAMNATENSGHHHRYSYITQELKLMNSNRQHIIHLPTRPLEALSDAKVVWGGSVRQHSIGVSYSVTVLDPPIPEVEIFFKKARVAAGSFNSPEHKSEFVIKVTRDGSPLKGYAVRKPKVLSAEILRENEILPLITMESDITGEDGTVTGTFTSGNYGNENVVISLKIDSGDNPEVYKEAVIWQTWNDEEYPWDYSEESELDQKSTYKYILKVQNGEESLPVVGHSLTFRNTSMSVFKWNPLAGPDFDEDGIPDGEYENIYVERGITPAEQFAQYDLLSQWNNFQELSPGVYSGDNTVNFDSENVIDFHTYQVVDADVNGEEKAPDGTSPHRKTPVE